MREMPAARGVVVSGLAVLLLPLALNACGDRTNERPGAAATGEPGARTDRASTQAPSSPTFPDSRSLKQGPLTPEAWTRAADLGSDDSRTVSEAQQALKRFERDAVPALVEVLEGGASQRAKHLAAGILGEMGVAADASIPVLQGLKLKGSSELSALVTPAIFRIEQWRSCGLAGLPDDAEVHLVGMYKGHKELDLQLGDSGHTTTEIDVVVGRTPRQIVLVLSAYDPVVWKVGSTSQARSCPPGSTALTAATSSFPPACPSRRGRRPIAASTI
jgi:hypothetical protein